MPVSFCRAPFRLSRFPSLQPQSQNLPRHPSPRLSPRIAKFPLHYMRYALISFAFLLSLTYYLPSLASSILIRTTKRSAHSPPSFIIPYAALSNVPIPLFFKTNHKLRCYCSTPPLGIHSTTANSSSTSGPDYVTAVTSVSAEDVAQKLASSIVTSKIAACVNTIPNVKSYYWWKGEVQQDAEVMLVIKTRATLIPRLKQLISAEHPYDLPELIVHPIIDGSPDFLNWIAESTIDHTETS